MLEKDLLELIDIGENSELECKAAEMQLPKSIWETYSSFANTNGGTILLGIEEIGNQLVVKGADVVKLQREFWDNVNNRQKVSSNILQNRDVFPFKVQGKPILQINVPRAMRQQKPVSVNANPYIGTYKRNHEGDYRCSKEEVDAMIAESSNVERDGIVLLNYGLADLDSETLRGYRQRFEIRNSSHDWNGLDNIEFLKRIGGWGVDRETGKEGLTYAGLLCFGVEMTITSELSHYFLDYREKLSNIPDQRWSHRITSQEGTWSGNLLDFYYKIIKRINEDIEVPFMLEGDLLERQSETRVHKALREALLNTLVHADHFRDGAIVIEKERSKYTFRNQGLLRVSLDKAIYGGTSDTRNKNIFKIFSLIGLGERSGYGLESIHTTWEQQHWERPIIKEEFQPEQVTLTLKTAGINLKQSHDALVNSKSESETRFHINLDEISSKKRIPSEVMKSIVLKICENQFLTLKEIASIVDREETYLRKSILSSLVKVGKLELKYPDTIRHKNQAYRTNINFDEV